MNNLKKIGFIFLLGMGIFIVGGNTNKVYASEITTSSSVVFYLESNNKTVGLDNTTNVNLFINNVTGIMAEDITISYNTNKLEYLNANITDGINIIQSVVTTSGQVRFILSSYGDENVIDSTKNILQLQFKTKEQGKSKIQLNNCKISDGINMERNVLKEECEGIVIKVNNDVNGDGEFTLLDLAIDSKYLNEDAISNDDYTTDVVVNGKTDKDDLDKISQEILKNKDYYNFEKK